MAMAVPLGRPDGALEEEPGVPAARPERGQW